MRYYLLFVFFFSTGFLFFHLHNLPAQFYTFDDMMFVHVASETSYTELLRSFFFVRDTALVHSCIDCISLRPGIILVWKLVTDLIPFNINFVYLSRTLFVTGISLFIFYFLSISTKKSIIAALGSIFYVTLPPVFSSTWLWGDAELIAEFFMFAALFFFYKLTQMIEEGKKNRFQKITYIILFILFFMLSFRTKETTKIFIVIVPLLTIMFYRKLFWWMLTPFFIILYYLFPEGAGNYYTTYSFPAIYDKVIASGGAEYSGEIPTIFSPTQHLTQVPSALLSQMGFFLGWFVLLSLLYFIGKKTNLNTFKQFWFKIKNGIQKEEFAFYISLFWFGINIPLFGFFTASVGHRYYAVILIPFTLLLFIMIDKIANLIVNKNYRIFYYSCFIILVLFVILVNMFHINYHIRGGTIGYHKGNFDSVKYLLSMENNMNYTNEDGASILFSWVFDTEKYENTVMKDTLSRTFVNGKNYIALKELGMFNASAMGNETVYFVNPYGNTTPISFDPALYNVEYVAAFGGCFDTSIYCLTKNLIITPKKTHFIYAVAEKHFNDTDEKERVYSNI